MAAGKSTRTYPLTLSQPKPLLPILGKPILGYTIEGIGPLVEEMIIIVGYKAEMVEEYVRAQYPDLPVRFVKQEQVNGTGSAVALLKEELDGPFLVLNGDDMYHPRDIQKLIASTKDHAALVAEVEDPSRFGVFLMEGDRPVKLVEKPAEPISHLANINAFKFSPEIFEYALTESARGEYEVVDFVNYLIEKHASLEVIPLDEYWHPVSYPWDILRIQAFFLEQADTKYRVDKTAEVDDTAFIGNNVVIGANCKVGGGVELENVCLFEGVTIEDHARVADSVIAEHVHVKEGVIIDGSSCECASLPIGGKEEMEVDLPYKGVFCESGVEIEGYHLEPRFITKEA